MQKGANAAIDPSLFRKSGLFASKVGYYGLWFEFLALSPSYELARRCRAGSLTKADRAKLPSDFDRVLQVYDDLGDVQRTLFRTWWRDRAFDYFGYQGERPRVQQIAYVAPFKDRVAHFGDAANDFIDGTWLRQGRQRTMIVAIPIGMTRGGISNQIAGLLGKYPAAKRKIYLRPPKYPLVHKKFHREALFRYISALWVRCAWPDEPLWKIGVRAKISGTYNRINLDAARHESVEDKYAMKILTHRAIERGKMIAENAARGIFPSYEKCPLAMEFNFEALGEMRAKLIHREKAARARKLGKA